MENIKKEDTIGLVQSATRLGIEVTEQMNFENICYKIMDKIESNDELLENFKNIAREKKCFNKLFLHRRKVENIRFFIDHQNEYGIEIADIEQMRHYFRERNNQEPYFITHVTNDAIITEATILDKNILIYGVINMIKSDDNINDSAKLN